MTQSTAWELELFSLNPNLKLKLTPTLSVAGAYASLALRQRGLRCWHYCWILYRPR